MGHDNNYENQDNKLDIQPAEDSLPEEIVSSGESDGTEQLDPGFWEQDRTMIHEKGKWFQTLSARRKYFFVLILLFVCIWAFWLGFNGSNVFASPDYGEYITAYDGSDLSSANLASVEGMEVILLVGVDNREGESSGRTDTIMLAFLDFTNNKIQLLSIPRDTYVQIPDTNHKTKVNDAYSVGGVTMTIATLEYFLGIDIDDYVIIDFQGFVDVIDAIGGVEVDVEMQMYNEGEGIDLQEGVQTLNGTQALGYVRYREKVYADIGRIGRQQKFIKILADELISLSSVVKIPQFIGIALDNVTTSLSMGECVKMASSLVSMNFGEIQTYMVPGTGKYINRISYWITNESELLSMLNTITGQDIDFTPHIIDDGGRGTTDYNSGSSGNSQPSGKTGTDTQDEPSVSTDPVQPDQGGGETPSAPSTTDPVAPEVQ